MIKTCDITFGAKKVGFFQAIIISKLFSVSFCKLIFCLQHFVTQFDDLPINIYSISQYKSNQNNDQLLSKSKKQPPDPNKPNQVMPTHDVEIIKSKRLTNNRPFNDFLFLFFLISETSLFLINSPVDHIDDGQTQQVSDLTR